VLLLGGKFQNQVRWIKWRNESVKRGQSDRENKLWYYLDRIDYWAIIWVHFYAFRDRLCG